MAELDIVAQPLVAAVSRLRLFLTRFCSQPSAPKSRGATETSLCVTFPGSSDFLVAIEFPCDLRRSVRSSRIRVKKDIAWRGSGRSFHLDYTSPAGEIVAHQRGKPIAIAEPSARISSPLAVSSRRVSSARLDPGPCIREESDGVCGATRRD